MPKTNSKTPYHRNQCPTQSVQSQFPPFHIPPEASSTPLSINIHYDQYHNV